MGAILSAQPLTGPAFAPYGEVIEASEVAAARVYAVNDGRAQRFHDLARLDTQGSGGRTVLSIFRSAPVSLPFTVRGLERHPLASQAFVPMHADAFLVVVAASLPDGTPGAPAAFFTNGRQGINFRKGTWHHSLLALSGGDFLVVDREGRDEDNLDLARLAEPVVVTRA